jgi:uncharacterized protein
MQAITNLQQLLRSMQPALNKGQYVFCTVKKLPATHRSKLLLFFKEAEGYTIVVTKPTADKLQLQYSFTAAWITLKVHSALEAVGLTAAFATALAKQNISCNVVAAYFHDHIFVPHKDAKKAMLILRQLSKSGT